LVHALKYDARRSVARGLSRLMRERCADVLSGADVAVPVPLHWRRHLTRGFNQAEDLARGLGLPVCLALRRARPTRPQFGLRPGERQRNVREAFRCRRWSRRRIKAIKGACVVLVDDVSTTGATLRECADVLKALGAREVRTATAARAVARRP
jgi:ComF family protein